MSRILAGLLGVLLAAVVADAAAPPPRLRNLTAEQEKEVRALQIRLAHAAAAGQFAEAARLAEQRAQVRTRWQGKGHWQAINARFEMMAWQHLAKLPRQTGPLSGGRGR